MDLLHATHKFAERATKTHPRNTLCLLEFLLNCKFLSFQPMRFYDSL